MVEKADVDFYIYGLAMSLMLLHEGPGSCDTGRRAVREMVMSRMYQWHNCCSEEK